MLFFGNFGAWISVDGDRHLEEYGVATDTKDRTVICYIASEEGRSFQVHWYDNSFESPTRGRVYIDGRSMGGKIIHEKTINHSAVKKGFRTDAKTRMPFVFSKLKLVDREDTVGTSSAERPGEINLIIIRVKPQNTRTYEQSNLVPETLEFNEKDVKGAVHNTTFGEPIVETTPVLHHEAEPYGEPIARFCFRYLPLDILRAKDLVPRQAHENTSMKDEEDTKAIFPAQSSAANVIRRSASTLVSESGSRGTSVVPSTSASSKVVIFDLNHSLPSPMKPIKRTRTESLASANRSVIKREKRDDQPAMAGSSTFVKCETDSDPMPLGKAVPTPPDIIDLSDI
ncbi:hypothetical protein EV361DRAFT_944706 [Lentinula raphanica]|nr:hypothetical protein EV361DRAFT_944706 [Lentinula raphanica]